jgi:N-glycosylase/DNA lyase
MEFVSREDFDLQKIADSGQCFRLKTLEPVRFRLTAKNCCLEITERNDAWAFDCNPEDMALWRDYFDLDADYGLYRAAVALDDAYAAAAVEFGAGIRILRQDPWETLVSFIISQRKNIPAIRACVENLCRRYGKNLGEECAFPTPLDLSQARDLDACSLGYRTNYVRAAAEMVLSGELNLAAMSDLSDEDLLLELMKVPGVGIKVGTCAALFGYHRIAAFPRDVWINRIVREQYQDAFPLDRYTGFAGVIQQYLFYYARYGQKS